MSDSSQGPGWWQASDGKWYPPEQAPGYQAGDQGAGSPASGGTDIGSTLSYAWNKFIQNIGEWIVLWLVLVAVTIIFAVISAVAVAGASFGGFRFNFVGIIIGLLSGAISGVLYVAIAKGANMALNGQKVDVAAAFKLTSNNIIAGVIFGLIFGLLNYFCFLFGIAAWLFLGFLPLLSAMDDKGADALGESVNLSTSHASEAMLFWLIGWFIGGVTCGIGAPIAMLGGGYLIKRYRGEAVA
ncbi:MAG: hypothetical protein U0Q07_01340 [Acidimicrobiales bacterium]